jgi:hypothetical protein
LKSAGTDPFAQRVGPFLVTVRLKRNLQMKLKYCWNRDTQLPELTDPEQLLQPQEWKRWNDEMARRVNLQVLHDGLEIEFPRVRDLPTRFRISKEAGPSNRVPNYTLESVEPWPLPSQNGRGVGPATSHAWPQQFLDEIQAYVENMKVDKESRPGLLYVLDDMRDLVRQEPADLAMRLAHAFAAIQYLRYASSPDRHRRALTYYEISLDALDAELLKELRQAPMTISQRLAAMFGLLQPSRDVARGGK